MKKLLTLFVLVFCLNAKAQYVTIPDTAFVNWLHTNFPSAMSGNQMDTTNLSVTTCTTVEVGNIHVINVSGIEYFSSVQLLLIRTNSVTTIPKFPKSVLYLYCDGGGLTTLPALPNGIKSLDCEGNHLTSLPALPNSLDTLICDGNSLTSIPALPDSMLWLWCSNNQLTSLPVLPASIRILACDNNNISCFAPFSDSINQFSFSILNNPFTCLPNYISAMDSTTLTYPLCTAGNANGCPASCAPYVSFSLNKDTSQLYTWNVYPNYAANVTNAKWHWGDGSSTAGLYPTHTYTVAGKYAICVTAYSSCGDSINVCQNDSIYRLAGNNTNNNMIQVNVINNTTGINQFASNNQINLYPNPAQNNFTIETNSTDKQTVEVFDVNGKLVLQQTIQGNATVDVSNLSNGIYNASIINNNGVANKKLVIVK